MHDCIFCKIVKGEIPSSRVFEDNNFIAFLDISPANKGHTLIVPKEHYNTLLDAPRDILCDMLEVSQKVAKAVKSATKAEGLNIQINIDRVAGQLVRHLHLHIIPRYKDDDFSLEWTHKKYEEGEMELYKAKIEKSL